MSNVGIYKITSPTNKVYIGQSWNLEGRLRSYKTGGCKAQKKIYNSIQKYGWDSHKVEIVMYVSENVTQEMFDQIEQAYMDYYRRLGFELMNIREAGSRGRYPKEIVEKIAAQLRGRSLTEEHKKKISEGIQNMDPEVRTAWGQKIRESNLGSKRTEETRNRMSEAQKGRKMPEHVKQALIKANTGRKDSEEHKKWMSERFSGASHPCARAILQYDLDGNLIREWEYLGQAANELGISRRAINNCCAGWCNTSAGYIWKYKTTIE